MPLTSAVDTFVGIAGTNWASSVLQSVPALPTCGHTNGLYPGYMVGLLGPYGVSRLLQELNDAPRRVGARIYTIGSTVDEVLGFGGLVWGRYTWQVPGQDGERRFTSVPYGHINSKDRTAEIQLRMVLDHVVP